MQQGVLVLAILQNFQPLSYSHHSISVTPMSMIPISKQGSVLNVGNQEYFNTNTSLGGLSTIYGIFGIITVGNLDYLIVVTEANGIGSMETIFPWDINSRADTNGSLSHLKHRSITEKIYEIKTVKVFCLLKHASCRKCEVNTDLHTKCKEANSAITENRIHNPQNMQDIQFCTCHQSFDAGSSIFITSLTAFFKTPGIYFSKYPLHLRYFNRKSIEPSGTFLFNKYAISNYLKDHKRFILNCIQGFFGQFDQGNIRVTLISRRSPDRIGARYFSRGANEDGHVSNFVETEQIVSWINNPSKNNTYSTSNGSGIKGPSSFVQIRGSIPLKWHHIVNLSYNPEIVIEKSAKPTLNAHLRLKQDYSRIIYLNLIQNDSYEGKLWKEFDNNLKILHNAHSEIEYLHFDFHKNINREPTWKIQSKNLHEKLYHSSNRSLMGEEPKDPHDIGNTQFTSDPDTMVDSDCFPIDFERLDFETNTKSQNILIRTNCMDSLDRTNSMQYFIGKNILKLQIMHALQLEKSTFEKLDNQACPADFSDAIANSDQFSNLFLNNGTNISIQYSGTPTLSSYYISHGKKTVTGTLRDLANSVRRYYINRIKHGELQDIYDSLTGKLEKVNIASNQVTLVGNKSFVLITLIVFLVSMKSNSIRHHIFNDTMGKLFRNMAVMNLILLLFLAYAFYCSINYPKLYRISK